MTLAAIIQDRTNDGISIVDFLFAVMRNELAGFKPCHRLDAAKLLVKYDKDEALNFTLDYTPELSRSSAGSGSSDDPEFERKLAKVIREATDDGRSVCRFLINVMEGELSAFKSHHRIAAARELLSRGFGKHATPRRSGEGTSPRTPIRGRNPVEAGQGGSHSSLLSTHSSTEGETTTSNQSPTPPLHGPDCCEEETDWDAINKIIDDAVKESDRIRAEQPEPDDPPYATDMSVFDEAWENSEKLFEEWKNSIDPEEYHAIIKEGAARFDAEIDRRIERRKQIKKDREQREKEEAERQAQQAKARAKAKEKAEAEEAERKEIEDLGPPPDRDEHERWSPTPSIPTSFRLVNCGHPKCKLHDGPIYYPEDDRNSPYYWNGRQPF